MAAIITEKFRRHNAIQFYESFSEASKNVYYLMIGKPAPFHQELLVDQTIHHLLQLMM